MKTKLPLRNHCGSNTYGARITIGSNGVWINVNYSTTLTQDFTFGGEGATAGSTTAISGSGSLIKESLGMLTLCAVNTYKNANTVSAGVFFVSGSLVSDVTVSDTATLAGGGTLDDLIMGNGLLLDIILAVSSVDSPATTTGFARYSPCKVKK